MHILLELLLREGAFLTLLLMLGFGPATYLSDRFDAGARWAMAPILGFCLGSAVTTTLLQFAPANSTYWTLVVLSVASVSLGCWRIGRSHGRQIRAALPSLRDAAQLAVVCLAVAGPLTYSLAHHHTVGPAAYYFTDVDGYVAEQNGAMTTSTADAAAAWKHAQTTGAHFADLT